ncbi:MAG: ParB/RepB/Spo0J family partition protein [Syntrophomonadaceae bacterium]|nr:ParB/RepB/Spo0J family partition protein [Syntrophomonadaceae bacterium]
MPRKVKGLGRGLDALFINDKDISNISELSINLIKPRGDQPRKKFNDETLHELAQSIKQHGILQPVLVRPQGDEYELIAGERRWRAAQIAGMEEISVIIREIDDQEAAEISLIENLQRDDLTVIEEALAYKNLIDKHAFTQEKLAERIGRSRSYITNMLRILNLPPEIIKMIDEKKISASHARTLLSLPSDKDRLAAARKIINEKKSVRQIEKSIKFFNVNEVEKNKAVELSEIETKLQKYLGTKAEIIPRKRGGKIEISYYNEEELERILELFGLK